MTDRCTTTHTNSSTVT